MATRTEITIETERILTIGPRRTSLLWCKQCATRQPMLTVAAVTAATGIAALAIFELAEVGRVHFVVTSRGEFLICPNSPVLLSGPDGNGADVNNHTA